MKLQFEAWFTRSVKNFARQEFFCFFKQSFERKKFSAYCKKFPAYIKETKKRWAYKLFYAASKKGFALHQSACTRHQERTTSRIVVLRISLLARYLEFKFLFASYMKIDGDYQP